MALSDDIYGFSYDQARRILQVAAAAEAHQLLNPRDDRTHDPHHGYKALDVLRCINTTPQLIAPPGSGSSNCPQPTGFQGLIQNYDSLCGTWLDQGPCWLVDPNGSQLRLGYFLGVVVGQDANGQLIYAVGGTICCPGGSGSGSASASGSGSGSGIINPPPPSCCGCSALPLAWKVTFSGIFGGPCLECSQLNGTWTLSYVGGCNWGTITPVKCALAGNKNFVITLSINVLNVQHNLGCGLLTVIMSGIIVTYQSTGVFNCLGANTLIATFVGVQYCASWPNTVLLAPA